MVFLYSPFIRQDPGLKEIWMIASRLRSELTDRAYRYATANSLPYCLSYGDAPVVCFQRFGEVQHGNFHPASFRAVQGNLQWRQRLNKVHTTAKKIFPRPEAGPRRELDSCVSSDALLMNVFCHPGVAQSRAVAAMIGVDVPLKPHFGFRARVPLANQKFDQTEVDMKLGNLLVEAKLTESDFQRAKKTHLLRYRDLHHVFDQALLPQAGDYYASYQLIRNVLAASASQCSFCVLLDARRPDLIEAWYAVIKCIRDADLRTACKVLTWQELSGALPSSLRTFLARKYGIGCEAETDTNIRSQPATNISIAR